MSAYHFLYEPGAYLIPYVVSSYAQPCVTSQLTGRAGRKRGKKACWSSECHNFEGVYYQAKTILLSNASNIALEP